MKRRAFIFSLLLFGLFLLPQAALATEGGGSYYFPGTSVTFGSGISPPPGFMLVDQLLFYSGEVDKAVFGGRVRLGVDASAFYNYLGCFYAFEKPVLGGRLQIGAAVPVGWVDFEGQASIGQDFRRGTDDDSGLGDVLLTAALYWKGKGNLHYKLSESVFVPTGSYSDSEGTLANVGRNYWGFDTTFTVTWMNMETGREFVIAPGILFNTENSDTDYQSGTEFHLDVALNQYLAQNLAVGLHGYYYRQLSGDSGSGAKLGDFKGESYGIGPALFWSPKVENGKLSVMLKWLHDFHNENRLDGDYAQLVVVYQF